jgi:hypothetical protein
MKPCNFLECEFECEGATLKMGEQLQRGARLNSSAGACGVYLFINESFEYPPLIPTSIIGALLNMRSWVLNLEA